MEHVQCRLYFCIAGADLTRDIVSFQVTFDEGSMCLFDKESLDIFKSSADKSLDLGYLMDGKCRRLQLVERSLHLEGDRTSCSVDFLTNRNESFSTPSSQL